MQVQDSDDEQEQDSGNFFNRSSNSPNFSEKKRSQALSIPHISVNQRNPHMEKAKKSYMSEFLLHFKHQKDPYYVAKVFDSEIRQISL